MTDPLDPLDSSHLVIPSLVDLGYGPSFAREIAALGLSPPLEPARVVASGRGMMEVWGAGGPCRAVLGGRLLHAAGSASPGALPTVGDWVGLRPAGVESGQGGVRVIDHLLSRRTALARKAAGRRTDAQVLAANVDTVLIVTSMNADFNPRRLERYLDLALEAGARPVVVLNKADLAESPEAFVEEVKALSPTLEVLPVSALDGAGMSAIAALVRPGETVVLLGSSGVGKSTIVNRLLQLGGAGAAQKEGSIRERDDRGKHTTTRRELLVLPGGGMLVDTPGIRELAPWVSDGDDGGSRAGPAGFGDVEALATRCRFRDCAHAGEPGCAVAGAVEAGEIDEGRVMGYQKLAAEHRYQAGKQDARARAENKRRWKLISKATKMSPKT